MGIRWLWLVQAINTRWLCSVSSGMVARLSPSPSCQASSGTTQEYGACWSREICHYAHRTEGQYGYYCCKCGPGARQRDALGWLRATCASAVDRCCGAVRREDESKRKRMTDDMVDDAGAEGNSKHNTTGPRKLVVGKRNIQESHAVQILHGLAWC